MQLRKSTELVFTMPIEGDQVDTRDLRVSVHEDTRQRVVLEQDGDTIWLNRECLSEILRQIGEWEAGEPA